MSDAGVPDGVYVNLFASPPQIETMIADPRIAGFSLTGSERAVLDTDDVSAVADTAWTTRIGNTGQACNSKADDRHGRRLRCLRRPPHRTGGEPAPG